MKILLSIILVLLVFFGLQFYTWRTFNRLGIQIQFLFWIMVFLISTYVFLIGFMVYLGPKSSNFIYLSSGLLLVLVPQLIIFLSGLIGDVLITLTSFFSSGEQVNGRRKFLGQISLVLGSVPFVGILHGIFYGKYNFQKIKHVLSFKYLPKEFDGYKIVHISDIHIGSIDNKEKIRDAVDMINREQADLLLFTGDLVNHTSEEVNGWEDILGGFKAKDGLFAVLGNHDYAPYLNVSPPEKLKHLIKTKEKYAELGFQLLNNENITLRREEAEVKLLGVEYWGNTMKDSPGDLEKALVGVSESDFKILMSHDPSHVEKVVFPHQFPFELSLSGHTHGMQFGIEIPGWIKWSPIQYVYKFWAGLYQENGQFLNVNRGFGYHAYSGRTGIWPEISVITLKSNV